MRLRPTLYVALSLLFAASQSLGGETLPHPDPPGVWRWMTRDDATTTSQCIGDFTDPFCTVDSVIECWARGRNDLCASAYEHEYPYVWSLPKNQIMRYKFDSIGPVLSEEQTMDQRGGPIYDWQPGDIRIDVMLQYCHKGTCIEEEVGDTSYFLRWTGLRWRLIDSADLSLPR